MVEEDPLKPTHPSLDLPLIHTHAITYQSQSVHEVWLMLQPLSLQLNRDRWISLSSWDWDDRERSTSQPQQ